MDERIENPNEGLVSACEPSMRACRFKQVPYDTIVRLHQPQANYAGVWHVGEWKIKPTYLPVRELDARNGIK